MNPQAQHLRRESSQSSHSDMNANMGNMPRGYAPQGGRGRGYNTGYGPPVAASPGAQYRQLPGQQRGAPGMPPQFQPQSQVPGSPFRQNRSPAINPAAMQQQMHYAQNPQMSYGPHGYPQHLNPQVFTPPSSCSSSLRGGAFASNVEPALRPGRPSREGSEEAIRALDGEFSRRFPFTPDMSSKYHEQYLTTLNNQGMYNMPGYYEAQNPYFQQAYPGMQQSMHYPGPPSSPRPNYQMPHPQQQYMPGQYGNPNLGGHSMSRSNSQVSERPPSVVQPQTPSLHSSVHAPTPSQSSTSPAPTSSFQIPKRSKAIVIKNAQGEEINLKDAVKPASPSPGATSAPPTAPAEPAIASTPAPSKSPAIVSSTPTPPPRAPSASEPNHNRTESKSVEERKNEFAEQMKRNLAAQKLKEETSKADGEARVAKEKSDAEEKANAQAKAMADAETKAAEDKAAEEKAAKDKAAEEKAAKDKAAEEEAAEAKAAEEKAAQDKADKEKAAAEEAAQDQKEAESAAVKEVPSIEEPAKLDASSGETDEERKKREEEEETERMIAEMEAAEREEEERERAFAEKKKKADAERKAREAAQADEEMKRLEREAEELEERRQKEKEQAGEDDESPEAKAEREAMFASLRKPTLGPGASATPESGTSTPMSDVSMPPPSQPKTLGASKPKPAALKLETTKPVEPAQPTPGMQSLKSARFLAVQEEINYPGGIKSPNPALNQTGKSKGRQYDKTFLLQFADVFKEKPNVEWDNRIKETLGDGESSARPQSARTPAGMGGRSASSRQNVPGPMSAMGSFGQGGARTLPQGTTSQQRFEMAQAGARPGPAMTNPLAQFSRPPPSFGMGGAPQMARGNSFQQMGGPGMGPNSPRGGGSQRGKGSRRGNPSQRDTDAQAAKMPLTAGQSLTPLQVSQTGWKPTSVGKGPAAAAPPPGGHLPPDMVQRKVKSNLNKMTPDNFDRISEAILEIAAQSKDEADGRTLRQVIQLTFEKACDEAHWASMYAKFCKRMLETMSPEIKDENVRDKSGAPVVGGALFRKYLLNRCQEEFERGWEVNLPTKKEGESEEAVMLSDEYYIAAAAKRRGLGLIQFIGELYRLSMLTSRIMHECVLKLLNFEGAPDENAIESLVKLLRTIGATMDASGENGQKMMAMYFERIQKIMETPDLPSRMQFMLLDTIDLRKAGWKSKNDAKGPKTIQEIHAEAAAAEQAKELERARTSQRGGRPPMGRGDTRQFSGGGMMPPPQDYRASQVGMDDLRKLTRGPSRQADKGPASLGPGSSMFGPRSGSGRKGLTSGLGRAGEESGASSRTATPPKQEAPSHQKNAFRYGSSSPNFEDDVTNNISSALAGLDASGEGAEEAASTQAESKSTAAAGGDGESKAGDGDKPSDS